MKTTEYLLSAFAALALVATYLIDPQRTAQRNIAEMSNERKAAFLQLTIKGMYTILFAGIFFCIKDHIVKIKNHIMKP